MLRPLIPPSNTIAAFASGNALVITDYADNLRRLEKVIASLDQPPGGEPMVVPVRHASAIDLVPMLNRLLADAPAAAARRTRSSASTIVADARSNSVLIRSDNPGRAARVRQLIEQLDTPGRAGGNMFIVYLKNAEAARVVQTLRALLTGQDGGGAVGRRRRRRIAGHERVRDGIGAHAGERDVGHDDAAAALHRAAGRRRASPRAARRSRRTRANNALVILAPEHVYNNLRAVIEKLDVRRAQVYVEALIVEVSADKAAEFGIQWQALTGINSTQTRVVGGTNFGARGSGNNIIDIAANLGSAGPGPQPRRRARHDQHPRPRRDPEPRVPRARARDADQREHPVDADAADARQRGGAHRRRPERAVRHRPVRADRHHRRR